MLDLIEPDHEAEAQAHTATVYGLEREAETRRNVGRFVRAMWIAVFVLLLFNSAQLVTVVNGFGVGPVQDTVVAVATTWDAQMKKNGLDRPVEMVRVWVIGLRDMTWDELRAARGRNGAAGSLRGPQDNAPG
jgi:hypothetical protein